MIKPNTSTIPGMDAVTDTLDFVKNLWGGMSVPGMGLPGIVMPTLSVEEINKQIADLKAVESWLSLNMNMLRGTIQALEVQRATSPIVTPPAAPAEGLKKPDLAPEPEPEAEAKSKSKPKDDVSPFLAPQVNPAVWWNMLQDQFKQAVNSAMASEPATPPSKPATAAKSKAVAKPKTSTAAKRKAVPKA